MVKIVIDGEKGELRMSYPELGLMTEEEYSQLMEIAKKLKERVNNDDRI